MNHPADDRPTGHVIRLRGPCNLVWTRNGTQQAAVRVQIPCKIEPNLFEARKIEPGDTYWLQRTFRKPTGLEETQTVTLELSNFEGAVQLRVNHECQRPLEMLVESIPMSVDITQLLEDLNKLEVEFESLPAFAGDVRLVISES